MRGNVVIVAITVTIVYLVTAKYVAFDATRSIPLDLQPSSTPLKLPADFDIAEQPGDEWCDLYSSTKYLTNIAAHHNEYCQRPESRSSLECFRHSVADERPERFCVARGVQFSPDREVKFDLHCQERNWISEALQDDSVRNLAQLRDFPDFFFDTGAGMQLRQWNVATAGDGNDAQCSRDDNDGKFTMLVKREGNSNIWHTMMEVWSAMSTLDILQITPDPSNSSRTFLTPEDVANLRIVFQDDGPPGPVYDFWEAITGREPLRLSQLSEPECMGNVILPIAGSGNPFWHTNGGPKNCTHSALLDAFRHKVLTYLGIPTQPQWDKPLRVTIIDRKKTRRIVGLEGFVQSLEARNPQVKIQALDFGEYTLREQLEIVAETDVLVGVHGAGLTHTAFVPDRATIAEIEPAGAQFFLFCNVARVRGLTFLSAASKTADQARDLAKRWDWQENQIYMDEDAFVGFVEMAIETQRHRGALHGNYKLQQ